MTECPLIGSFVVRVYRIDPEDHMGICGLVEIMDGTGVSMPFSGMDELGRMLAWKRKRADTGEAEKIRGCKPLKDNE